MNASSSSSADAPSSPSSPQPAIRTMQQDLAAATRPSRFDLRHQRSLPPSKRMEDLRLKPAEEPLSLPLLAKQPLLPPPPPTMAKTFASPIFLWLAGLVLSIILLSIIIAILLTL